jgi:hypothetical protein
MTRLSFSEARENLSGLINKGKYRKERILVNKHEKDTAAHFNIEDLHLLDVLIGRYENDLDIEEAERVLAEENKGDFESWEDVKS